MSELQITQLTSLPEAGIQSADVAAVADISASETKKVTIKDFVAAGITLIDDASIPGAKIGVLSSNQVNTGAIIHGPPIGTNTTGQEAEGPNCIGQSDH